METPRPQGTKKSFQRKRRYERERRGDEGGLQAGTAAGGDHAGLTLISQSESTSRPPCAASSMTGKITPSADFPFVPLEEIGQIMTNYPGSRWVIARRGSHHPGFSVRQPRRRTSRSHTRAVTSCSRSHSEHDDFAVLRFGRRGMTTRPERTVCLAKINSLWEKMSLCVGVSLQPSLMLRKVWRSAPPLSLGTAITSHPSRVRRSTSANRQHVAQTSSAYITPRDVLMCQVHLVAAARGLVVVAGRLGRRAIITP